MGSPAATGQRDLPGDFAICIFTYAELPVFGIFFRSYAFARAGNLEQINIHQQLLDRESGALHTVILITSSRFVVRAVNAIRTGQARSWDRGDPAVPGRRADRSSLPDGSKLT